MPTIEHVKLAVLDGSFRKHAKMANEWSVVDNQSRQSQLLDRTFVNAQLDEKLGLPKALNHGGRPIDPRPPSFKRQFGDGGGPRKIANPEKAVVVPVSFNQMPGIFPRARPGDVGSDLALDLIAQAMSIAR